MDNSIIRQGEDVQRLLALMRKAQEIAELLQRAIKLGYSISMPPEQMQIVVEILECADLVKIKRSSNGN